MTGSSAQMQERPVTSEFHRGKESESDKTRVCKREMVSRNI